MHARQPERERRREGVALPSLRLVERNADTVTLEATEGRFPPTNIAPGSEVGVVEQGERTEICRGLVSRISSRRITIEFPGGAPRQPLPRSLTVNLLFDAKVFEAYHSAVYGAIRALGATTPMDDGPDGLLRAALLGETDPPAAEAQRLEGEELTDSQRDAINTVLSGGRVRLVHGPPGTGKTHTLVHLAMALAKAGHSVLVTADSNAAVDNLVVGLRRNGALAVRVGHAPNIRDEAAEAARIDPMDAPLFVRWAAEQGIVVATTNYGAFRYIDPKGGMTPFIFDYVIHDEAGQATAPSSLAAVLRGRRLVLAGDPKQLPPTVVSMDAKEAGLDVTLFERIEELTGHDRTRMLDVQFRMREPIVAFSNKRYYEGKLKTDPAAAAQEGLPGMPAAAFQHVTGRENERQRNGSISNDYEVEAIASLVEKFRPECRDKGWTMAVLSPYQAQREAIRRKLPDIEVSTVDGAQGREWDVVLYSTVRSNPQHRLGFVEDERRLNVAVTRARRNFILVGDERTLRDNAAFNELLSATEKVRFHYPDPVPHQEERWERRGRRGGRDGGRDRRDGGRDRRDAGRDNRDNRGPRRDEGQRQPQGREAHNVPRDAPRTEQHPPQQPAPQPPREPQAPSPFIHNGRRRRGGPPGDPQTIPLVDPFQAPRPERRSFIVGAQEQPQPVEPAKPAAPAREAPTRRSRKAKPAPAVEPPAPVQSRLPLPEPAPAPKPASKKGAKKPAAKAAKVAEPPAAKPAAPKKSAKKATTPPEPEPDGKCAATTQSGEPCKNKAKPGSRFCARHG
jgi:hypothetical protein